jgi:hypothetical protein
MNSINLASVPPMHPHTLPGLAAPRYDRSRQNDVRAPSKRRGFCVMARLEWPTCCWTVRTTTIDSPGLPRRRLGDRPAARQQDRQGAAAEPDRNVRPIPPGDPDFQQLFRIRNDAESINRGIEDSLYIGRAHSIGHERQLVNLLGYGLMVNGIAMLQRRRRLEQPPTAVAA